MSIVKNEPIHRKLYAPRARIKDRAWMRGKAIKFSSRAFKTIYEMIIDPNVSDSVRMNGAQYIINRAFGMPEPGGDSEAAKQVIVNILKFTESDVRAVNQHTDDNALLIDAAYTDDLRTDDLDTDDLRTDDTDTDDLDTDKKKFVALRVK